MVHKYPTPKPVKKAVYASWWKIPAWQQMHCSNAGNNLGICIGGNGTGKSWNLGAVAEDLGYDHRGEPSLFNTDYLWEHVAFDTKGAALIMKDLMKVKQRKTVGYQIIIEEGQLSLYSKDAFQEEVKDLSRMLMTVRSRRWGIYINLPTFGMLNKDVRSISNWLIWMKGRPTKFSYGTFYHVNTNMYTGEPYIKKPTFNERVVVMNGLEMNISTAYSILPFPAPSKKFIKPYEKMKAIHQEELFTRFADNISIKKFGEDVNPKVAAQKELDEFAKMVLEDRTRFWNESKKRFITDEVVRAFSVSKERANKIIGSVLRLEGAGRAVDVLNYSKLRFLGDTVEKK